MKANQMSDGERATFTWLVNKTKPELKRHRRKVIIVSIVVSLVVLGIIIWYWNRPTVAYSTSLLIGGGLYALWGALLLALGAFSNPLTLGLMSMTRAEDMAFDGNSKLFTELMKSRFSAIVGVCFVVGGFSIQSICMLLLET